MGDINKKLASLTPEQAKQLAAGLNSVYTNAEKGKKKPSTTKKKPAAKGKK